MRQLFLIVAVVALAATSCAVDEAAPSTSTGAPIPEATPTTVAAPMTTRPAPAVTVGAEVLVDQDFAPLAGQRVGLIANQTSRARGAHLIDVLHDADVVELAAVFAPEHGVRGDLGAGELLGDSVDPGTGVTVFSLYGETRQPTSEMLAGLDVLVYDLQDVGARFYTYISTMGLAMQAAAEAGISFVVLDRPIPGGGQQPAGFVRQADQQSFIGQYPIPAAYGLTAGELARAIKAEGWLDGLADLDLEVVPMQGWTRSMQWPDTGRAWVPPSPGLRTVTSALAYPGTVLFEATSVSFGGGTRWPFSMVGAPWVDGEALAAELNERGLAGIEFRAVTFVPRPLPGITSEPRLFGQRLAGVRYVITDDVSFEPVATGIHVLEALSRQADAQGIDDFIDRPETFDLLAGTTELRRLLVAGESAAAIVAATEASARSFDQVRQAQLLYD